MGVSAPFGDQQSAGFTPLVPARTWPGAIRAGESARVGRAPRREQRR
jgi:hypothetical protein